MVNRMTTADAAKINARCKNDWRFDVWAYCMRSEKQLEKRIPIDEKHFIKAGIYFSDRIEHFRKVGLEITLHISKWEDCGATSKSWGLGLFRRIPYDKSRRTFADLEKLTEVIDDSYIMEIYNTGSNAEKCLDNILLDKSGWHVHEV